jgi:hypothetical protein
MGATETFIINSSGLAARGLAKGAAYALLEFANLKNVNVINGQVNPYDANIPPQNFDADTPLKKSALGTPIYTNLVIGKGSFVDNAGVTQSWEDIEIDNIIMSVTQQKKIVVTEIQGRDNDVKEYIGLHDYQIDIQGAIFGYYNNFPRDLTKDLKKALSSPQPLVFASWWLQLLDITTVVVFDFNMPQTAGEYSTQYFTATVKSDVPVEISITGK